MQTFDVHVIRARSIDDLRLDAALELLQETGLALCEPTSIDPDSFSTSVDRLMATDPLATMPGLRLSSRETLRGATAHGLRNGFCLAPCITPRYLALYCARPPLRGGDAVFCDGVELLAKLSDSTRRFFEETRLRFTIVLPFATWKILFGTHRTVLELSSHYDNLQCRFSVDGLLHSECVMSAINRTHSGVDAFANPLLHAFDYPAQYGLATDRGIDIPSRIETELRTIADRLCVRVPWKEGMFFFLDNTRILHGRERSFDDGGKVIVRQLLPGRGPERWETQ